MGHAVKGWAPVGPSIKERRGIAPLKVAAGAWRHTPDWRPRVSNWGISSGGMLGAACCEGCRTFVYCWCTFAFWYASTTLDIVVSMRGHLDNSTALAVALEWRRSCPQWVRANVSNRGIPTGGDQCHPLPPRHNVHKCSYQQPPLHLDLGIPCGHICGQSKLHQLRGRLWRLGCAHRDA
eukprot:499006-Amphidinium_carterae.2